MNWYHKYLHHPSRHAGTAVEVADTHADDRQGLTTRHNSNQHVSSAQQLALCFSTNIGQQQLLRPAYLSNMNQA